MLALGAFNRTLAAWQPEKDLPRQTLAVAAKVWLPMFKVPMFEWMGHFIDAVDTNMNAIHKSLTKFYVKNRAYLSNDFFDVVL